jgi:hypothetical protein
VVVVMMVMVVPVPMVMVVMMDVRHEHDAAMLMQVPDVPVIMAHHFPVKMERLRRRCEADGERQRGDRRKQRLSEHLFSSDGCFGLGKAPAP